MRPAAPTGLAIAILLTVAPVSHAEFRHLSSRLLAGGGNEFIFLGAWPYVRATPFAASESGDLFLVVSASHFISFGGANVGPGTVVARLDASGSEVWSRVLGSVIGAQIRDLAAAGSGLVLVGSFNRPFDFGGATMTPVQQSDDAFVVKLDEQGHVAWQQSYGDGNPQQAASVAVAPNGDIVIVGSMQGTVDFGGGPVTGNGGADLFVVRLDANGGHVSSRQYGQNGLQEGMAVAVGPDGQVGLTGRLGTGGIDFGGGFLAAVGSDDMVVAVLDAAGGHVWSRIAATPLPEHAGDIAFDASGNVFLAGSFSRRLDLGGEPLIAELTALETGFVGSYDAAGTHRWSYALSDSLRSSVFSLAVDESGNCLVMATKVEPLVLAHQTSAPSRYWLLAFDATGQITSSAGFGAALPPPYFTSPVLMATAADAIFLTGSTDVPMDFGNGVLDPDGADVYLAKLAIRRPPRLSIHDFNAELSGTGVRVTWSLTSGEPLAGYFLTRRIDGSSNARIIHSAPAVDGDASFLDDEVQWGHVNAYELSVETALGDAVSSPVLRVTVPWPETALEQNAPNPFNPVTTFAYSLAEAVGVSIVIYDPSGAVVARLDQGMQSAGRHEASWGGHNMRGELVASGVYFYRLEGVPDVGARKMLLLK